MAYIPGRGDVIWLMFDPGAGQEQAGRRPALVISPRTYHAKTGLCLVCPISSQVKGYPFEVVIPPGLPISGVVLSDQVKSVDWKARRADYLCTLSPETSDDAIEKIMTLLE